MNCALCGAEPLDITIATLDENDHGGVCGDYDVSGTAFDVGLVDKLDRDRRLDALESAKGSTPSGSTR